MKTPVKRRKPWGAFLLAALLTFSVAAPAKASSAIDPGRRGSITINVNDSTGAGLPLGGIRFTIYQVAQVSSSGVWSLTKDFAGSGLQLDRLSKAYEVSAASKMLESYVSVNKIAGLSADTDSGGTAVFRDLALGYYLVMQPASQAGQAIGLVCDSFLLAVPMETGSGGLVYDIVTNSKSQLSCGAVILQKTNSSGMPLSGAVFRLERKVSLAGSSGGGSFTWSTRIAALTTNSFGQAAVEGLPFGEYRFIETSPPAGYQYDPSPHNFTISAYGSVTLVSGKYVPSSQNVPTVSVINNYYVPPPPPGPPGWPPYYPPPGSSAPPPGSAGSTVSTGSEASNTSNRPGNSGLPVSGSPGESGGAGPSGSGFHFPKTGGSVFYAVCVFGGVALAACGAVLFVVSRKKK